ncbi:MAG: hypothetical protein NC342_00210 [Pseudoflavonifractor sp.]|nr:hypothetical protein [Alloprevotella sp.]MCM1115950.1 hypothetical protein [Pseudoflavonifractor sp.]
MKHTHNKEGRVSARFTSERDRDFLSLCRQVIATAEEPMSVRELVGKVINSPAPCYYADYEYALHIVPRIGRMSREEASKHGHGRWLEIYDRATEAIAGGEAATMTGAIALVLSRGRASRFFISVGTALEILRHPDHRERNLIRQKYKLTI